LAALCGCSLNDARLARPPARRSPPFSLSLPPPLPPSPLFCSRQEIIPPGSPSHDGYDSGYDSSTSSTAERIDKNLINLQFNGKDGEMVKFVVEMEWSEGK